MRKLLFLFILIAILALIYFVPRPSSLVPRPLPLTDDQWYPFVLAERLDPNSPANMGKLVLDPPAGKHGFCKAKDGHFYFEDGTPIKFWGTNLCFNACFPTKEQAELIADRIAFFGFNAVRLHHMDTNFEPRGIFEDVCPDTQDPQMKKTGTLSKEQLNRLDYLIYQLKKRGIYMDMNLLVKRRFTLADGVIDADKLGGGAKPFSLFDSKLIGLQKQYAKNLLTHYNPHTKLRYCDDPSIALIEIVNENSLFQNLHKGTTPNSYKKQLKDKRNKWRLETKGKRLKEFYIFLEKKYFDNMFDFLKNDCNIKIPITGIGGYSKPENLESQSNCDFIDTHAYWDHIKFPNKRWDKNDFIIHDKSTLLDTDLGIIGNILKKSPQTISPAALSLNPKPYTISEWNHCLPNQYAYETPTLIAAEAAKNNWDGLFQFAFSHGWKTGPNFDFTNNYFDIIANAQKLILCSIGGLIFQKSKHPEFSVKNGVFKLDSPQVKGIAGFIKNTPYTLDPTTILSNQNGAVFLYSTDNKSVQKSNRLIFVAISEIKNKDSGWKNEQFNWGTPPTLLKKMDVEIKIDVAKNLNVYELDSAGKRGRKIKTTYKNNAITFSTQNSNSPWFEIAQNKPPIYSKKKQDCLNNQPIPKIQS